MKLDIFISNEQCLVERDHEPFVKEDDNHSGLKVDIETNNCLNTCRYN